MSNVRLATGQLFGRYYTMLMSGTPVLEGPSSKKQLMDLIGVALEGIDTLPIDKLNRWLGFIQATVVFNGLTTVQKERDFSRPLFHAAYEADGIAIPETVDIVQ
jgi:hypothetical protein